MTDIPDYVKEACPANQKEASELPVNAFADDITRTFPIHTAADTWLSCAYYNKAASELNVYLEKTASGERIKERLNQACEFWGIEPPVLRQLTKAASAGIRIEYKVGDTVHDSTSVSSPEELTKVAEDIIQNTHRYPWQMRRDVGRQVLAAAPALSLSFSGSMQDQLNKSAGYGVGDVSAVARAITQRQVATRRYHTELQPGLSELKEAVDSSARNGVLSPDMLDKVASVLDAVDRVASLHIYYQGEFQAPEKQIYTTTMSQIDSFTKLSHQLPDGRYVPKDILMSDRARDYAEAMLGEKVASLEDYEKLNKRQSWTMYDYVQTLCKEAECPLSGALSLPDDEEEEDEDHTIILAKKAGHEVEEDLPEWVNPHQELKEEAGDENVAAIANIRDEIEGPK